MTIQEAQSKFERLKSYTEVKSEIRTYQSFVNILSELDARSFTETELNKIQDQLAKIEFDSAKKKKSIHFLKQFNTFKSFLKTEFSLVGKNYYTGLGMSLGMALGMSLGISFMSLIGITLSMTGGMIAGMVLGMFIGQTKDKEAEKENRVLSSIGSM